MNTVTSCRRSLTSGLLLLTLSAAAPSFAQPSGAPDPGANPSGTRPRPPVSLHLDYSFTDSGTAEFRGRDRGESGAESINIVLEGSIPLFPSTSGESGPPRWRMPLGLTSRNFFLDEVPGAPVPESIHTLSLNTGLSYRLNEAWTLMARVNPTLYRTSGVSNDDLGVSGGFLALWRQRPNLTWTFGLVADPDGEFDVLPIVGANWAISPELTLSLVVPRPRLTYHPDKGWSWHVGASLNGTTFRTSDTFGTERGELRYNDALASYRDIRIGAGFETRINRHFDVHAEAGYSVSRQIEYTRIDERVKFDPAPYFQIGLRAKF